MEINTLYEQAPKEAIQVTIHTPSTQQNIEAKIFLNQSTRSVHIWYEDDVAREAYVEQCLKKAKIKRDTFNHIYSHAHNDTQPSMTEFDTDLLPS